MDKFLPNSLSPEELQRQVATTQPDEETPSRHMSLPNPLSQGDTRVTDIPETPDTPMVGGDSIDDIIRDNSQELQWRRSSIQQSFADGTSRDGIPQSLPTVEFGGANDGFRDFQFGSVPSPAAETAGGFGDMTHNMALPGRSTALTQPSMMALADTADFTNLSNDMMGNMVSFSNLNMGQMPSDPSSMGMFGSPDLTAQFPANALGPINTDFSMDLKPENNPLSAASANATTGFFDTDEDMMTVTQAFGGPSVPAATPSFPQQQPPLSASQQSQPHPGVGDNLSFPVGMSSNVPQHNSSLASSFPAPISSVSQTTLSSAPATPSGPEKPKYIYSKSGFDMMRALFYVATRKNPEVYLGAVDMSCAFVVCDVSLNDCPIIYVSDNFQNLTGYSRHEIVGKNCRFLQAPDGNVEAGVKREFVENSAVYNLKMKIEEGKEVQQSLINYRKGGKPFLNLLTMIPIPWDTEEVRFFVGFQIDLVECPDAIAGNEVAGLQVNYKHSDIGQYIWTPPASSQWDRESGQTLGVDDVSTLLQQFNPKVMTSEYHKQSWDKMLLENMDDVVHVLSLKGLFLYLSPSCKRVLEYDAADLVGNALSSICHPSDIVPITRELKDATVGSPVNIVFRIRRKVSGYTWFESHGSLFIEQGKGRKCVILVGRKRPAFTLHRKDLEANGGIGDSEMWTKLSTSGMFLFVSSNVRSLLDLQPENLEGTSIQDLMRKESRAEFGRSIEKARKGKIVVCKHEVQNHRGQVLHAQTTLYPGDVPEGQKPTFLLAQTKLLKASSRSIAASTSATSKPTVPTASVVHDDPAGERTIGHSGDVAERSQSGLAVPAVGGTLVPGVHGATMESDDNIFEELKTTRCTSWQYELRQMERANRMLAEELGTLLSNKKKRKRRKGVGNAVRDCANCHTRSTPEWRRGPSGQRDLCNSCGLRWAKQTGRVSPRNSSRGGSGDAQSKKSNSPIHSSPLHRDRPEGTTPPHRTEAAESSQNPGATGSIGSPSHPAGTASSASPTSKTHSMPPPSQPLLEGGSGAGGSGMEMTSIIEEREQSAS